MSSLFKVGVEEGDIHVEYVDVLYSADFCHVLEIGTREKHPSLGGYCSGEYMTIELPETDYNWPTSKSTKVSFIFHKMGRHWFQIAQGDRYHVNVILWTDSGYRETVWRDNVV